VAVGAAKATTSKTPRTAKKSLSHIGLHRARSIACTSCHFRFKQFSKIRGLAPPTVFRRIKSKHLNALGKRIGLFAAQHGRPELHNDNNHDKREYDQRNKPG